MRVYKYSPQTGKYQVLIDGIVFDTGVAVKVKTPNEYKEMIRELDMRIDSLLGLPLKSKEFIIAAGQCPHCSKE